MERCQGIGNWVKCAACEHICTSACPIEGHDGTDVMAALSARIKMHESRTED
jgi:hypothetical protein